MKIFISYRRTSLASASRIYDFLKVKYKGENVFMDLAKGDGSLGIRGGEDFRTAIQQNIKTSGVVLCIIGKDGILRSVQAATDVDYLHVEIAESLKNRVRVVPVLVDGGTMPRPEELPDAIRDLAFLNAVEVNHAHFDRDMDMLCREISGQSVFAKRSVRGLVTISAVAVLLLAGWSSWTALKRSQFTRQELSSVTLDTSHHLMWANELQGLDVPWEMADGNCRNLHLGRKADWRLPDEQELSGAYNRGTLRTNFFGRLGAAGSRGLWSAKTEPGGYAWVLYLTGETESLEKGAESKEKFAAVCVRTYTDWQLGSQLNAK
jgi:hypothetical protein